MHLVYRVQNGSKMDQNLDKKRVFFRWKYLCAYSVTKMRKFDKFLTIFLIHFYSMYTCVAAKISEKFLKNF